MSKHGVIVKCLGKYRGPGNYGYVYQVKILEKEYKPDCPWPGFEAFLRDEEYAFIRFLLESGMVDEMEI